MDYERESVKSKRSYRYVVVLSFIFELIQIPIIYLHVDFPRFTINLNPGNNIDHETRTTLHVAAHVYPHASHIYLELSQ
jgi:hypothetical protein